MTKFSRPKNTTIEIPDELKNNFHKEFAELSENKNSNVLINLKNEKSKNEILKKISLNIREGEIKITTNILNKLIDNGMRDPIPTITDIYRVALFSISKLSVEELIDLFTNYRISSK